MTYPPAMRSDAQSDGPRNAAGREPDARDSGAPRLIAKNEGLVARNLGKQYKKRPVLRDVSIRVQRGEAVGLLGPNGAGKTTSFYIITGLIAPDYGTITLDGQDLTDLPMYRRARLGIEIGRASCGDRVCQYG